MTRGGHARRHPPAPWSGGARSDCGALFVVLVLVGMTGLCGCTSTEPARRRGVRNVHFDRVDGYLEYTFR